MQKQPTAKDDLAVGLKERLRELFAIKLQKDGLNLDANVGKKKALLDFLRCLPRMLEQAMKKEHITKPFVESGMTDDETGSFPSFDSLIATCKRWGSSLKDVGILRWLKVHCREQFQHLAKIQQDIGQVSYTDMLSVGFQDFNR